MLLYEYFELNEFDDVLQCLYNNYVGIDFESYKIAWDEIKRTDIISSDIDYIIIEKTSINSESFISVYGKSNDGEIVSIEYLPWGEWLGLKVETNLFLNPKEILCHVMYEMTFNGFSMGSIQRSINELKEIVKNINDSEEFYIINKKDIEPIIFKSYQLADITTEKASKMLEISKSEFVQIYEKWLSDDKV